MNDFNLLTLADITRHHAQQRPDSCALVHEDNVLTYADLDKHANQVAQGLLNLGVQPGVRIAILGKDSDYHYEILFGCAKAKAVLIGINWRLATQEVAYILQQGEVAVLFVTAELLPVIEALQPSLKIPHVIALNRNDLSIAWPDYQCWRAAQASHSPALTYAAEDIVLQLYTSGTTGYPKGVQLPNYSFFRLLQGMCAQGDHWMSLQASDRLLLTLPQFHVGGAWWAIQGLIAGAQGIIMETFIAWKALELIARYQITKVAMVPAMIQTVLAEPDCQNTDLSSVQGFLYGGSPIAPALLYKAMATFQCDFFQIYGMTETGNMAVCLRPEDHKKAHENQVTLAGKPLPGVEVRIIDLQDRVLPNQELGEICIKSPSNMVGYWKNELASKEIFFGDWIRTGDVGFIDDEGYVHVCDRLKDMIIYGGENIYPAEVEAVLSEHLAVAEVAVIGIPDERWGEVVKAFVVLRPGQAIKQRELINFARQRIADFKAPKSIDFVDALPRNPSGKVLKRVLRAPYWEQQARQVN